MQQFHRAFHLARPKSAGQEIGPFDVPEERPVEGRPRPCAGVQQNVVGNAGFSPHHILGGCDAKCLNNGLSGERPQPPDVISALAAVELRQVDDAAVQKSGHCLRFRIGKHAHCLDPGGEERFEPLGLPGGDIPLAAWHKHEPDKFGLHPVGRRNILRA